MLSLFSAIAPEYQEVFMIMERIRVFTKYDTDREDGQFLNHRHMKDDDQIKESTVLLGVGSGVKDRKLKTQTCEDMMAIMVKRHEAEMGREGLTSLENLMT